MLPPGVRPARVWTAAGERDDCVAAEEPLEVRVTHGPDRQRFVLSVTLRTPGHDRELAAGLALADGLIDSPADLRAVHQDGPDAVRLELQPWVPVDPARHARTGYTSAACGLCGKGSVEAVLRAVDPLPAGGGRVAAGLLAGLPDRLRAAQPGFAASGGLHAAGLFAPGGELLAAREDVGRHNAVDKLVGAGLLGHAPAVAGGVVCVSGRAGFELVQKAAAAGAVVLVAVGAPSSLAVELAARVNLTLVGFARAGRCNVYSGAGRVGWPG